MWEVMWSHIIIQAVIMVGQTIITLVAVFGVLQVPSDAPLGWLVLLCFMQGFCGVSLGR